MLLGRQLGLLAEMLVAFPKDYGQRPPWFDADGREWTEAELRQSRRPVIRVVYHSAKLQYSRLWGHLG